MAAEPSASRTASERLGTPCAAARRFVPRRRLTAFLGRLRGRTRTPGALVDVAPAPEAGVCVRQCGLPSVETSGRSRRTGTAARPARPNGQHGSRSGARRCSSGSCPSSTAAVPPGSILVVRRFTVILSARPPALAMGLLWTLGTSDSNSPEYEHTPFRVCVRTSPHSSRTHLVLPRTLGIRSQIQ